MVFFNNSYNDDDQILIELQKRLLQSILTVDVALCVFCLSCRRLVSESLVGIWSWYLQVGLTCAMRRVLSYTT